MPDLRHGTGPEPRSDATSSLFQDICGRVRARRLRTAERDLRDASYYLDKWGFPDPPSRQERDKAAYYRLIRRVYELGGEPLDLVPFRREYDVSEALPDVYKRVPSSGLDNRWSTVRV